MNRSTAQSSYLFQFLSVVVKETVRFKVWVVLLFALVSLAVLGFAILNPKVFRSAAVVKIDDPSIRPSHDSGTDAQLMDPAQGLRQSLLAPELIKRVATIYASKHASTTEDMILQIEQGLVVQTMPDGLVRVSLEGEEPEQVYDLLSLLTETVVADSNAIKRDRAKEHYLLIDQQTKNYKAKIIEAENRLKQLAASNYDGSEQSAQQKINSVRQEIQAHQADIEDAKTQIKRLEVQIDNLTKSSEQPYRASKLRNRLNDTEARLEEARQLYSEDDPNVVDLHLQIEDLKYAIAREEAIGNSTQTDKTADVGLAALQGLLSTEKAGMESTKRRLARAEEKLDDERQRLQRIGEHQTQIAALTRDYNITKATYEELLSRKEEARLAMTLDNESNTVTYSIDQAAFYPSQSAGLRFEQYAIAGPILGALLPLAFIILYVMFDSRIRFQSSLEKLTKLPILGEVPRLSSPLSQRMLRTDVIFLTFFVFLVAATYAGLVVAHLRGAL